MTSTIYMAEPGDALTPSELQTARLAILDGLTEKEVADRLGIGYQTVKNRLSVAYRKTETSRLIELGIARGWVREPVA